MEDGHEKLTLSGKIKQECGGKLCHKLEHIGFVRKFHSSHTMERLSKARVDEVE
jgi:hypothetical protein